MTDSQPLKPNSDKFERMLHRLRIAHARLMLELFTWRGEANTRKAQRWRRKYLRLVSGGE